ncbi:MAG: LacI family transcriptional regulator [Candidatus Marinimicrobia bacterium]|nr:LacI family transcriptional regulator [Candidatus Neomarinimicrobiota bacterium]MCK9559496.1 LacI family transcriptional regulator [Candidatus Neomarinimicrobiota bacterium]MDD5230118.1 LacI family DNA-binding transcriptional regulator [Candidatus Neomarinimicrobiota bacterium]MDD5540617.1 LacI family DNA-binding transcriptional regulator [Candidatus Neomarinimicrobiota bacterium]
MKSPTIREIARIAECSLSTVSKAINGRADISESTRRRILKIVGDNNYTPSALGKGLKNQRTENIGVIFSKEDRPLSLNPFYSRILEGIEAELAINKYNLVLCLTVDKKTNNYPKMIRERNVDGVILISVQKEAFVNQLMDDRIPLVLVDPNSNYHNATQVVIDNEDGAFQATQYLILKGHKKIAFISPHLDRDSFRLRYAGFNKAMTHYHLSIDENYVQIEGLEHGYDQVRRLLQLKERPTAMFIANDLNVMYAYQAIRDLHLKIPEDISIVGFDDIAWSKIASPQLTTMRVYKEEMGSIAVRNLLNIISNDKASAITTILPVKLIERNSVKDLNE